MSRVRSTFCLMMLLIVGFSAPLLAATNDSGATITWGYKGGIGPEFWGRLNPQFILCGKGKAQSPINISQNDVEVANKLTLHYQPSPLILMDDGFTELNIGNNRTIINDGHTIQVNFHDPKRQESITYAGNQYQLLQLHFHSPSENELNSESAPLEIHFVHQGENGRVVVIGVLVKGGSLNPALQVITEHLPEPDGKEHVIKGELINPQDLFPLDHDYYSYMGSLTTPPCTEGLQWIVMAGTITASPAQIATIRQAIGGSNARSVQPLNGRVVAYAMGANS